MQGISILVEAFRNALTESVKNRVSTFKNFRALYDNDYEQICRIIYQTYKDKPYLLDNKTNKRLLDNMVIIHQNIIHPTLARLTSGIYDKEPMRIIDTEDKSVNETFSDLLVYLNYNQKVLECLKKALYFNVAVAQPIFRFDTGDLELDILTPDSFQVETYKNYLKMKSVVIERADELGHIYYVYWDKDRHFIIDEDGERAVEGNPDMVNPYNKGIAEEKKILQFATLRINEGTDFFGEPDWDLYLNQLAIDLKLSDMDYAEILQRNPFLHGVNTEISDNQRIGAGVMIQSKTMSNIPISLDYVRSGTDFDSHRRSVDWRTQVLYRGKNIVGSTSSIKLSNESGLSKAMDLIPIEDWKKSIKDKLYYFEIDLLKKIIRVYNTHVKQGDLRARGFNIIISEEIPIEILFPEQKPIMTASEKRVLREYQKKYFIKDEIDFIMEDLEISEEEAIEYYNKRKERATKLGLPTEKSNSPFGVFE